MHRRVILKDRRVRKKVHKNFRLFSKLEKGRKSLVIIQIDTEKIWEYPKFKEAIEL